MSRFPEVRLRRLRRTEGLRRLVREARLEPSQVVWPLFFTAAREPSQVPSLPGVSRHPVRAAAGLARAAKDRALGGVLLFGIPETKDEEGSAAWAVDGVVQDAIRRLKDAAPDLVVITDVCLCEYTAHGHCGVVVDGAVENDPTLALLARTAVSHAVAGADIVAPSDMMDGRVQAIRRALDAGGHPHTAIMSYAAKYASAFYGPFREAAGSAPAEGDRRGYQMDPANDNEALREMALDIDEGADIVMVKPGMPCLDILRRARERFDVPLAAYQVSGEYAMIHAAGAAGMLDAREAMREALLGLRRAGADIVITYAAPDLPF
jgi:porphobilinogen synthase